MKLTSIKITDLGSPTESLYSVEAAVSVASFEAALELAHALGVGSLPAVTARYVRQEGAGSDAEVSPKPEPRKRPSAPKLRQTSAPADEQKARAKPDPAPTPAHADEPTPPAPAKAEPGGNGEPPVPAELLKARSFRHVMEYFFGQGMGDAEHEAEVVRLCELWKPHVNPLSRVRQDMAGRVGVGMLALRSANA